MITDNTNTNVWIPSAQLCENVDEFQNGPQYTNHTKSIIHEYTNKYINLIFYETLFYNLYIYTGRSISHNKYAKANKGKL